MTLDASSYVPELGVFARVFPPGTPDQVAQQIRAAGFTATQLNLSAVGRPTLDDSLTAAEATSIARAFTDHGVRIWGVSGTFNVIHPDAGQRRADTDRCIALIGRVRDLGADVITLCTGTRTPDNMWKAHPDNDTTAARDDLLNTLGRLISAAAAAGIRLGIEPEPGNVIIDAYAAQWLLAELGDDADKLAIVLDPSNLVTVQTAWEQDRILRHAFDVLGALTEAVHAKDVVEFGYAAPGVGVLDYNLVMSLHSRLPHPVPVIAQDLTADDAPRVYDFLAEHAAKVAG